MDSQHPWETPPPHEHQASEFAAPSESRRAPEPWRFLDLLLFAIFFVGMLFVTFLGALAVYAALRPLMGWRATPLEISQNTSFLLSAQLVFYILIFAYIYALVVFHYRLPFWRGIQWGSLSLRQVSYYILGGVLLTLAVQFVPAILPDKSNFPLQQLFNSPASAYATAIFAVVIAPFMEELIFRGFLFSVFELRVGMRFAVIVTAILFGAMHAYEYKGAWNHLMLIFVVGLVLSLARGLTGKLAPSVLLHVTYNGCLMLGLFFATSHFHVLQGL
jgi:membrane protease YdiL (CAAX protease family)